MELTEKTIKTDVIYNGNFINLEKLTVKLPNGKEASREVVRHPGAVAIVPLTSDNEVLMVRQYRKPLDKVLLEIPAGKLNYGEDPFECGVRELEEETGCTAEKYTFAGQIISAPGFSDEVLSIYIATGLKQGSQNLDEDEFLTVEKIPFNTVIELILKNEIEDAKTIVGILKTKLLLGL